MKFKFRYIRFPFIFDAEMKVKNNTSGINVHLLLRTILPAVICLGIFSCGGHSAKQKQVSGLEIVAASPEEHDNSEDTQVVTALLVSPKNPSPGQVFHVLVTGGKSIRKAKIGISSPSGEIVSEKSRSGDGLPFWRIDEFKAGSEGEYHIELKSGNITEHLNFPVTEKSSQSASQSVWKTERGWDSQMEALYSAW
ncbi:MAG: hypothetical protein Q8N05_22020, partial [Bacteroidota bacterium]|nr:hypothetical protein [Bacteroidota bacterium]